MKRHFPTVYVLCYLIGVAIGAGGCTDGVPLFDPTARPLNRIASAQEMLIETNLEVSRLRDAGMLKQSEIDSTIAPSLNRAEEIIKGLRAVARGRPTTQPSGTLEDVKQILLSVQSILEQIERSRS